MTNIVFATGNSKSIAKAKQTLTNFNIISHPLHHNILHKSIEEECLWKLYEAYKNDKQNIDEAPIIAESFGAYIHAMPYENFPGAHTSLYYENLQGDDLEETLEQTVRLVHKARNPQITFIKVLGVLTNRGNTSLFWQDTSTGTIATKVAPPPTHPQGSVLHRITIPTGGNSRTISQLTETEYANMVYQNENRWKNLSILLKKIRP
jgi:inosine/xanthosine triphosphate pyrophosphatase family protein